jgi:3-hydroxymyristoyl/3-hydroxydecanoyl-(acyl carrier protein) dehydratase
MFTATKTESLSELCLSFFGIQIPDTLEDIQDGFRINQKLETPQAHHSHIGERGAGLYLSKTVLFSSLDSNSKETHRSLSLVKITNTMCSGHFPGNPMLPLADAGKFLAQAAAVLASSVDPQTKNHKNPTPIVARVGDVKAHASKNKTHIIPGEKILLCSTLTKAVKSQGIYYIDTDGFIGNFNAFSMPKVCILAQDRPESWGDAKAQQEIQLRYYFDVIPENFAEFNIWAENVGMKFWSQFSGVIRYQTSRHFADTTLHHSISGNHAPTNVESCVTFINAQAYLDAVHSKQFKAAIEQLEQFIEPGTLHHRSMEPVFTYFG